MSTINASTARQTLPDQLDRVEAGEEVAITRHGRVIAVLVHPEALKARRAPRAWDQADRLGARLEEARHEPLHPAALDLQRAENLVDGIRADRAAQ